MPPRARRQRCPTNARDKASPIAQPMWSVIDAWHGPERSRSSLPAAAYRRLHRARLRGRLAGASFSPRRRHARQARAWMASRPVGTIGCTCVTQRVYGNSLFPRASMHARVTRTRRMCWGSRPAGDSDGTPSRGRRGRPIIWGRKAARSGPDAQYLVLSQGFEQSIGRSRAHVLCDCVPFAALCYACKGCRSADDDDAAGESWRRKDADASSMYRLQVSLSCRGRRRRRSRPWVAVKSKKKLEGASQPSVTRDS